jgi:hypothetical protein
MTTAALGLAVTAACGADDARSEVASLSGSTTTTATDGAGGGSAVTGMSAELEDAMVEFATCMREQGIDFPDPGAGGGLLIGPDSDIDPEDPDFEAAEATCKPILDEAEESMPEPSEEEIARMRDEMLAFARCMRSEGIDFPDPEVGEGGRIQARAGDMDDPELIEAQETCSEQTGGIGMARRAPAGSDG